MKQLVKAALALTPYRIVRDKGANRFQAIETALRGMKARGFAPKIVIDGGAHLGSFSIAVDVIFPDAKFHLIEPQRACRAELMRLCIGKPNFSFRECALAERQGSIDFELTNEPNTGAHVTSAKASATAVTAETLDCLFSSIAESDRTLLKMDLQGYELHVLRGATNILPSIEVILTEVSFFAQDYEPPIATLISFLNDHGFQLYDIAALAGRTRDNRLQQGDFIFVRSGTQLVQDGRWA